jgi:predicted CxxxxCH...CXXCH cytochrome family protein
VPPFLLLWLVACDGDGDSSTAPRHHPVGYYDFNVHGPDAKLQSEACTECHGDDLEGGTSGIACTSCHVAGWKRDCVFCHGGTDNATGAPPRDVLGATDPAELSFAAHTAHVGATSTHAAFDCTTCHAKPTDVLSPGHVFVGDDTPGVAEVDVTGGLNPKGTYDGLGCDNLYCHGSGQGDDGSVAKDETLEGCNGCHLDWTSTSWSSMGGHHQRHMNEGFDCSDCHADTVNAAHEIVGPDKHVDGSPTIHIVHDITWTDGKCTGTCHDEVHSNRVW